MGELRFDFAPHTYRLPSRDGNRLTGMSKEWITYPALKKMGAEVLRARISENPQEAARWVEAAALNGLVTAQIAFGQMLVDGHGVARDPAAGLRWFRLAAGAGSAEAVNMVGRCHELGWGVAVDKAEAARHYAAAAAKGDAWAQFNLATLLLGGNGGRVDRTAALGWYLRSARAGNAKSMTLIGRYLEHGWDRPARPRAALRWYRRGALGGDYRGQFDYARLLLEAGRQEEALVWFGRSVEEAVPAFCREVARGIGEHPYPPLRAIALRAIERASESDAPEDIRAYAAALASGLGGMPKHEDARVQFARARKIEADLQSPGVQPTARQPGARHIRRIRRLFHQYITYRT